MHQSHVLYFTYFTLDVYGGVPLLRRAFTVNMAAERGRAANYIKPETASMFKSAGGTVVGELLTDFGVAM